jgi:hypothetical protein
MKLAWKIFLAAFVISLALSFTGPGSEFLGGILKPAATIFFMLFFITMAFGRMISQYDEEQPSKPPRAAQEPASLVSSEAAARTSEESPHEPCAYANHIAEESRDSGRGISPVRPTRFS